MENINLEWFFKLPGLFITGGVFLILVAIIVYLIGSSKEKKARQQETNYGVDSSSMNKEEVKEEVVTPLVNPTVNTEPVNSEVNTIGGQPVNVVNTDTNEKEVAAVNSFNPVITPVNENSIVTPVETPKVEPVVVTPQEEVKEEKNLTPSITPIITPIEPVNTQSEVSPLEINVVTPNVNVSEPVVQEKMADEAKAVEVNVAPLVEVSVPVSEPVENTINNTVPEVKEEVKIEPVFVTPTLEPKVVTPTEEVKVDVPNSQAVEVEQPVKNEDTIEEI